MKRVLTVWLIFITTIILLGCSVTQPNSGGGGNSSKASSSSSSGSSSSSSNKQRLIPKLSTIGIMSSVSRTLKDVNRSGETSPILNYWSTNDMFVISADDPMTGIYNNGGYRVFIAQCSSPIFTGFAYATYQNGQQWTSAFYTTTVTTTATINEDNSTTFTGVWNNGGGILYSEHKR